MRTKSRKTNKINVVTLGCSKNVYDSEVLMGQLKANGKAVAHEEEGNVVVINTCGFIDNAKEESVETRLLSTKILVMKMKFHKSREFVKKAILKDLLETCPKPILLKIPKVEYQFFLSC